MDYSRSVNEQTNYDEYNRNNDMINNIRFNNRYSINNTNDSIQMNNVNMNIDQNALEQNQNILQNQNNTNNFQNYGNNNNMDNNMNNNINENFNNSIGDKNNINTINKNRFFNLSNGNFNNAMSQNINNNLREQKIESVNIPSEQNENNLYKSQDINLGLNEWVRNDLESRGLHVGRSISPRSIRMSQINKKKALLENIQAQLNLKKRTKLEELNKRKQEDAKYLQDMVIFYPFGRGGGGAPNRDKSGNIITNRRALISDPKYNFASINVDDDYDEVWNREKRIGRFYKNSQDSFNENNINDNQNNQGLILDNNNNYNNNNYNNPMQYMNNNDRPFSTYPRGININNNPNNQFRMRRRITNYNQSMNDINVNNELLLKLKEQNEILERQLEEERENERLRKEIEKEEEEKKKMREMNEENEIIKEYNNIENNVIEKEIIDPDSIILDKNAIERINRSEIEGRNKLNNEIYRLRSQMQDQQMLLFQQISNLKTEAEKANSEREEALREIERLKLQIYKDNKEDRQKRYIHHVIVTDDGEKNIEKSIQTEQPKNNEDTLELNKLLRKNIDRLNYLEEIERLNAIRRSPPSNYELEFPKNNIIPEKEEDDDLYEIEISKVHN